MLKWFRLYNKFILVIGGCLLMVAFLIQPVLSMFMPNAADQPLGTLAGNEITLGDQQFAGNEISLARQSNRMLAMITPEEPLQWILMKHEAAAMGISASGYEVAQLMVVLGLSNDSLDEFAKASRTTADAVKESLRSWLTIQNYKELLLGTSHSSPIQKIQAIGETQQMFQNLLSQGQVQPQFQQYYMQMYYQRLSQIQTGAARVSKPVVEHFINDQQSRVKVGVLEIPATRYLDQVALETQKKDAAKTVTEAQLQSLFEDYKDNLVGTSKPYGFGYRLPERVKLEYLNVPTHRIKPLVKISEADAVTYYDENPASYSEPVPANKDAVGKEKDAKPATRLKPYTDVRLSIIETLKYQKAKELGDKIIKAAQTMLLGDIRKLNVENGYRVVSQAFKAKTLEAVAKDIQKQFGILPDVKIMDKDWLTASDLNNLQGINYSSVLGKSRVQFSDYIFSVKEIEREKPHANAGLRLQCNVVSLPLASYDGGRYLFRILDAQAERSPKELNEVREAVVVDAKKLAAFSLLLADRDIWRGRLTKDSLQFIATELKTEIQEPPAFQRRQVAMGGSGVPNIQGIGQDEQFVDGIFAYAKSFGDIKSADLAKLPVDKRSTVVAAPTKLSMYLVRLDEVHPVTDKQYEQRFTAPDALQSIGAAIQNTVLGTDVKNPFEFDILAKRVGFVSDSDDQEDSETDSE